MHGPRTQADRKLYARAMQAELLQTPNLTIVEGEADDLVVRERPDRRSPADRWAQSRGWGRGHHHRHLPVAA